MVGVAFKSTGHTFEFRLRWPVCSVCASAMTACLAGILRRNDNQLSTQPFQLVLKLPSELEPSLIQYGLVQAGLGAYIFTRQFRCTGSRTRHIPHFQIFNHDKSVVFADYRGCLVQKIVAYIGYCTVQTLDFGFELLPVGGKLHSFCQLLFMFSETVQWFDAGTIGERCKTRNSHIYANGALRSVYRFWNFPFRLNRNKPSASGQGNCYLFRCSFYPAAVAIADIADFGQKYAAVVFIEPETLRIAKGVMNPLSVREVVMEDFLVDLDDRGFLLLGVFGSRHGMALLSEVWLLSKL